MSNEIHSIPKGKGTEVRIQRTEFKGREYVDIRVWFQPRNAEEFLPTGKGVSFDPEHVPAVVEALRKFI